jgi:thiol-disulfide isomerase/thioredoxin
MSSPSAFRRAFLSRVRSVVLGLATLAIVGCGRRISEISDDAERDTGLVAAVPAKPSQPTPPPRPANGGEGWNSAQIDWQPYEAGLRTAKAQKKPVCLVFSTTWCPHCKNYSHVFEDPRIVARAREFVMIHLDADAEEAIAAKYAFDGAYIPRTFFLAPDGTVESSIHAPRLQSRYFYDERDPASLLAGMETARQKFIN